MCVLSLFSCVRLFAIPWTIALQAPLAGSAVIQPFGARLARAAAAAEGGAKLKMADKTPGGSQKASSKVIS